MLRVIIPILLVAVTLYALIDCVRTPSDTMPGKLPKFLWILLVLLIEPIGAIAWIIVSRVAAAEAKGGRVEPSLWSSEHSVPLSFGRGDPVTNTPHAPDDDPEFLEEVSRRLRDKQRREYQRKKRQEEKRREDALREGKPENRNDGEDLPDKDQLETPPCEPRDETEPPESAGPSGAANSGH